MIYEKNYQRPKQLVPDLDTLSPETAHRKSKSEGYMDLSFKILSRYHGQFTCAMAHYFEQNRDLVADPDMEIRVIPSRQMIGALTWLKRELE